MKKSIKIILNFLIVFSIVASLFSFNVFAASTVISFGHNNVTVGETVNVAITVNAGEPMYGVEYIINYDSNILEYVKGLSVQAVGGAGTLKVVESPSGDSKLTYVFVFKALKAGSSNISVADCNYSGVSVDAAAPGASASLSVVDVSMSSNADLKALSLVNLKLTPSFSPSVTTYNVTVANSVTECKIYARAADANAKVDVTGTPKLQIGLNTRTVVVTAPDGSQKTYTINITRSETADEPVSSDEPTINEDPLAATIEGAPYTVISDISTLQLFEGFTVKEKEFNGTSVMVAADEQGEYEIFYLKAEGSEDLVPFTYDEDTKTFTKLAYLTQGEFTYIFAELPDEFTIPQNYYRSNTRIAGFDVSCYSDSNESLADFYYVYCFNGDKYSFYRYDSSENVLQRFPELKPIKLTDAPVDENEGAGFLDRFSSLTVNAKIIVISVALLLVAAIVLIVLVLLKLFKGNEPTEEDFEAFDFSTEPFDSVSLNNFSFTSESEETDFADDEEIDDLIVEEDEEQVDDE